MRGARLLVRPATPAWLAAGPRAIAATAAVAVAFALGPGLASPGLAAPPTSSPSAPKAPPARAAALQMLSDADPARRLAGVQRLAESGTMADVERLTHRLRDADETVRTATAAALWLVWSRSGDAAIDRKLAEGTRLMSEGELGPALALFDQIVKARPAFAEGWNKRATVLFLLGRNAESLRDCEEVLKRNPHHFGALSGMAQIHLRRGELELALKAYEGALEVNPNLVNGPEVLRMLQEAVRKRRGSAGGRST